MKTKLLFSILFLSTLLLNAQTQIGADINGSTNGEFFGQSISLSSDGTRIVIGAPYNSANGQSSGAVKIYDYNGSEWIQAGNDINGIDINNGLGFSTAISADGNRIATGGYMYNGNTGYVSIYDWNGSNWIQVGSNIVGEAATDYSGYAIDLSSNGNRIVIGAIRNDGNGTFSGHARIYDWNGTSWIQLGNDIDGENAGDESGNAVAISSNGNRVAIGASLNDGTAGYAGHVRVFDWNDSSWVQVGADIDGEAGNDRFGTAVDLSTDGNRIAIGGWWNDGNGTDAGHVRIFDWNGSSWVQAGVDIDGENGNDGSGMSVALSDNGNRVAIGAWGNDGGGSSSGHLRVYDWNGLSWVKNIEDIDGETSNDNFGTSVAISSDGQTLAAGAIHSDGEVSDSGDVRVYDLSFELNLVAYYPFNGNANDESGYTNHGTINGATLTTDRFGNTNSAFEFDGIDDFIQVANSNSLNIFNSDLTISMWLFNYSDSKFTYKGISKGGYDTGAGYELVFNNDYSSDGELQFNISKSARRVPSINTYNNQWVMLTATYTHATETRKTYINGVEKSFTIFNEAILKSSTSDLYIGKRAPGNNYIGFVNGKMDDIRIYNSALTATEILNLYNLNTLKIEKFDNVTESPFYVNNNTLYFKKAQNLQEIEAIEVYNSIGQKMLKTSNIKNEISFKTLPIGVYILKVKNFNSNIQTLRFLIN
jgi:hypothetical protein